MSDRDEILGALPEAAQDEPLSELRPRDIGSHDQDQLWRLFSERLEALGGRMAGPNEVAQLEGRLLVDDDAQEALAAMLQSKDSDSDAAKPSPTTPDAAEHTLQDESTLSGGIWAAEVGVTLVDLAVAETGSLLIASGKQRRRLASLAPPHHVALVRKQDIVSTLEEAIGTLHPHDSGPSATVLITGPSRTADIEGVMVRGVHGPGELWVVVL